MPLQYLRRHKEGQDQKRGHFAAQRLYSYMFSYPQTRGCSIAWSWLLSFRVFLPENIVYNESISVTRSVCGLLVCVRDVVKWDQGQLKISFSEWVTYAQNRLPCTASSSLAGTGLPPFLSKQSYSMQRFACRGVTRLAGPAGQKASLAPGVRTWALSEANVVYWKKYLWHCRGFFCAPCSHSERP